MERSLLDRWTDTAAFRLLLFFSALVSVPVLLLGLVATAWLLASVFSWRRAELEATAIVLLSIGGALGLIGYFRALWAAKAPSRHNLTATLVCLGIGSVTALCVAGFSTASAIESWRWSSRFAGWTALTALFIAAHVVWAAAGVGSWQRLTRRYAAATGRAFDSLPVLLLLAALALATTAVLLTAAL